MGAATTSETELTPELIERVLKLSPENRDRLIGLLGASPPIPEPPVIGDWTYWKAEIARRIAAVESGEMKTYTIKETMEYLRNLEPEGEPK